MLTKRSKGYFYEISEIDEGSYAIEGYKETPSGGLFKLKYLFQVYADSEEEAWSEFKTEIPSHGWKDSDIF